VHARLWTFDPVDGEFVDTKSPALSEDQQFGVEEPGFVTYCAKQLTRDVTAECLEAALGIAEPRAQRQVQEAVVGARDELALGPPYDARAPSQPRTDRQIAVTREQRRDPRQQPVEPCR
jgi:hypothetical protein